MNVSSSTTLAKPDLNPAHVDTRPWKVTVQIGFEDKSKAFAFESYLKSGSGHAFAKKHF